MNLRSHPSIPAILFLFTFYWRGLKTWFYQDDFGWLHLLPVHGFSGLLSALFLPKAHGNMRPWSENGFFMALSGLFGIEALPFRIVVFVTVVIVLILLANVVKRITGSVRAVIWTQFLWLANSCVAVAFSWTSIYNQTQYLLFILLAFWLLLKYIDSGDQRYLIAQWVVFLLGFGSLEVNVVYPALAAWYTLLFARKYFVKTLPLFAASGLYMLLHFALAPVDKAGPYALHFGPGMFSTLWTYLRLALGPERLAHFYAIPEWAVIAATAALAIALVTGVVATGRIGLFAAGWFVILLAPLLPLRDHVMDYYLTGPVIGLALIGGAALATRRRALAAVMCSAYLLIALPAAWSVTTWHLERSLRVKNLVLSVVEIHRIQPEKAILLTGVDTDLFFAGIADLPFELYGIKDVYLAPGADLAIQDEGRLAHKYVLPAEQTRLALASGRATVFDASGPILKNVSSRFSF